MKLQHNKTNVGGKDIPLIRDTLIFFMEINLLNIEIKENQNVSELKAFYFSIIESLIRGPKMNKMRGK